MLPKGAQVIKEETRRDTGTVVEKDNKSECECLKV